MSEDWDVYCVDCDSESGFYDANHQSDLMLALIRNRNALAMFATLDADPYLGNVSIDVKCAWGYIRCSWFAKHAGHRLVARSEYGNILEPEALPALPLPPLAQLLSDWRKEAVFLEQRAAQLQHAVDSECLLLLQLPPEAQALVAQLIANLKGTS